MFPTKGDLTVADTHNPAAAASTRKRLRASNEGPPLPEDLVLEIVARSDDAAAVIRCAATSKPLRRAILDPAFRRRLAHRATASGGFDPALLVAVSCYRLRDYRSIFGEGLVYYDVAVQPSRRLLFDDTSLLQSFHPASSRDGLLVLWRDNTTGPTSVELCVCNTFSGHVTSLPPVRLGTGYGGTHGLMAASSLPAFLTVDGTGHSFELLVMGLYNDVMICSSHDGHWRPIRLRYDSPLRDSKLRTAECMPYIAPAAVIGRTVHWLCSSDQTDISFASGHLLFTKPECKDGQILILACSAPQVLNTTDPGAAWAREIELPQGCLGRMPSCIEEPGRGSWCREEGLLLLTTADGRLGLLVAEEFEVSMWTLSPAVAEGSNSWSRQVMVQRQCIENQIGWNGDFGYVWFIGFRRRSGTVILLLGGVLVVQVNLVTKKATLLPAASIVYVYGPSSDACMRQIWSLCSKA